MAKKRAKTKPVIKFSEFKEDWYSLMTVSNMAIKYSMSGRNITRHARAFGFKAKDKTRVVFDMDA